MENKKIIISLVIFVLFGLSCKKYANENDKQYYNEQGNIISVPENFMHIKLNLYQGSSNNLYIVSEKNIFLEKDDSTFIKNIGILLQDTVYFSSGELAGFIADLIDLVSYREIENGKLYCDRKYVYYCGRSEFSPYPFYILENINIHDVSFLDGNYFKDNKHVYSYGGLSCFIIKNANPATFKVIEIKNRSGNRFYFGIDERNIYYKEDILEKEDLKYLDLAPLEEELMLNHFRN